MAENATIQIPKDMLEPAIQAQEQIARQVADAKKLNGNASLWDIENRRVVRTLANDCVLLTERVRILREAAQRVIDNWSEGDLADAVRELSFVLEATKEGA